MDQIKCAYDELVSPSTLVLNPKNPNKHPEEQIARLAKVIDFQGQRSPIVVSNRSGFIVVGHGRLAAMKALGWDKVAINRQDFKDEAEEYAHMTADNAIAEWANLDLAIINADMLDLGPDLDIDMLGIKHFVVEPMEIMPPDMDSGERKTLCQMAFTITEDQRDIINDALVKANSMGEYLVDGNDNKNGNAIARICEFFYGKC